MASIGQEAFTGCRVPDLYGSVETGGGDALTIARPCHGGNPVGMRTIGKEEMPCCRVPYLNGLVIAGGGDAFAVGGPGYSRDPVAMAAVYTLIYRLRGRSSLRRGRGRTRSRAGG